MQQKRTVRRKPYYAPDSKFNQKVRTVGNVAKTAGVALSTAKLALSLVNPEFKFHDVKNTITTSNTGTIILLNAPIKGTDNSNRVGRSIKIKSNWLDILIGRNPAATVQQFVRCMLVLDKDPNGVQFTLNELLIDTTFVNSPRNLDHRNRLVILRDYMIPVGTDGQQAFHREKYRKMEMHTIYNGASGAAESTIAAIEHNALFLVFITDATATQPFVTYYNRIRFLDN